jgi:Flp pilus assembly protein TadD
MPEDGIRREEQGDLLADAVTGAFFGGEEPVSENGAGPAEPDAPVTGPGVGVPDSEAGEGGAEARESPSPAGDEELPSPAREEDRPSPHSQEVPEPPPVLDHRLEGEPEPIPPSPWEQKMAWAKDRAREGRWAEAEELYRELLQENPDSVRARNNLGILLDENGDHQGAVAELRIARQLDPRNGEVLGNLGAALGALGRYPEAEEALRTALRMDPSNQEIRANLGILYFRKGLYGQAEAELGAVCTEDPDHGTALYYRGEALNLLGRVDEAIEVLSRAVELVPGNPRAYHTLGVLFDKKRLPERAASMYRKARELAIR